MDAASMKNLLLERQANLDLDDKQWMRKNVKYWYNRCVLDYNGQDYTDRYWKNIWQFSFLGKRYRHYQALAKKFLSSEKKMNHVMDMMEDREIYYSSRVDRIKDMYSRGELTQDIMAFMASTMRKENLQVFESYVNDPIFDTGSIVQFRSNIGVGAILKEINHSYNNKTSYHCADKVMVKGLKDKTLMVLGECPPLGGRNYAGTYCHSQKQGGSRLYRVLPVGDTKVYIVVEKFLKKCRTKAVKDARK